MNRVNHDQKTRIRVYFECTAANGARLVPIRIAAPEQRARQKLRRRPAGLTASGLDQTQTGRPPRSSLRTDARGTKPIFHQPAIND
jgi:hypothetical protein